MKACFVRVGERNKRDFIVWQKPIWEAEILRLTLVLTINSRAFSLVWLLCFEARALQIATQCIEKNNTQKSLGKKMPFEQRKGSVVTREAKSQPCTIGWPIEQKESNGCENKDRF